MQWSGYTSFVVGAVLPIFVSIPCLFHYLCLFSCLFLAFYSLFVSHAISTQLDRYINVYIYIYKKKINLAVIFLIVFIHQLLCIENTNEQLPNMNFCHPLQENISSFEGAPAPPRPPAYRFFFFWLRHWILFTNFIIYFYFYFVRCWVYPSSVKQGMHSTFFFTAGKVSLTCKLLFKYLLMKKNS